ncbi:MAG: DUF3857 domain-containing transglutaminase family protein [Flavipsychrobacter sp.]
MHRVILATISTLLFFYNALAQDDPDYDAIAQRYSSENAVITNNTEHLVIKYDNGDLSLVSYITEDRLLISDQAPNIYNTQTIYHSYFNTLDELKAESLIPDGRRYKTVKTIDYKTTASERDNVFYDDAKQTQISFARLVKGAITHVHYSVIHKDPHFLPVFYFQNYIPVVSSRFEITAPKTMKLKFVIKGDNAGAIKQSVQEKGDDIIYTWTTNDLQAIKSYDDAPAASYYVPHIIPYIESYELPERGNVKRVLANTDDLYHYYYHFIKDLNKHDDATLDSIVREVTRGDIAARQKAQHIYEWVQKNMHYVAFEDKLGGFIPREAADICKRKFGDCKDMSSIQVALYRKAGIEAHFTWIGTRHIPYTYEEVPLPITDNHMICTIKLDGKWVFLDGTDPLIPFGVPPAGIQGKEALIGIDADNYKIVTVPVLPAKDNITADSTNIHLTGGDVAGTIHTDYKGYHAWGIGEVMMYRNDDEKEKAIRSITSRGSNKFMQHSYNYKAVDDANKDVNLTSEFEIKDYAQSLGKEYYINLNLQRSYMDEHVDAQERTMSIEHDYKNIIRQVVTLDIPKGYHVSYLPPNKQQSVEGLLSYKITYSKTASQVRLVKEFELQSLYISPAQFAAQNNIVEDLKKQYKESVVLTAN